MLEVRVLGWGRTLNIINQWEEPQKGDNTIFDLNLVGGKPWMKLCSLRCRRVFNKFYLDNLSPNEGDQVLYDTARKLSLKLSTQIITFKTLNKDNKFFELL